MTHDPFQTYAMLGAYSGVPTLQPFTQQNYGQFPGAYNPFAIQQQLQHLSAILAAQTNPQWQGLGAFPGQHNPFGGMQQTPFAGLQQNPFTALQQNPLIAATLQNPLLNPLVAQIFGQHLQPGNIGGTPYGQSGYPLAPQSWIGQGGLGQIQPLYQQLLAQRGLTGGSPWGY